MTTLLSLFEERKLLEEKLRELDARTASQKTVAVEEVKRLIAENCLLYKDLSEVIFELRAASNMQDPEIKSNWRYYNPELKRGWPGHQHAPTWFLENLDKADSYFAPGRVKRHTPFVLSLLGRAGDKPVTRVDRIINQQWIQETSDQLNRLYVNNYISNFTDKYNELSEAEQEAIFDKLLPDVQKYLTS